jgi:hypothetical protein
MSEGADSALLAMAAWMMLRSPVAWGAATVVLVSGRFVVVASAAVDVVVGSPASALVGAVDVMASLAPPLQAAKYATQATAATNFLLRYISPSKEASPPFWGRALIIGATSR